MSSLAIEALLERACRESGAIAASWCTPRGRIAYPPLAGPPWDAGLGDAGLGDAGLGDAAGASDPARRGKVVRSGRRATSRLPRLVALGARFLAVRQGEEPPSRLAFAAADGLPLSDAAIDALHAALAALEGERLRGEEAERRGELALLGHAAAGAAHDLRNLLSAALLELDVLDSGEPRARAGLRGALDAARELACDFLELEDAHERRPVELGALLERELGRCAGRALLRADPGAGPWWIAGKGELVARVLANLLANALEASPRDRPVEVSLERAGALVELAIADRGRGMDQEALEAYLEPGATRAGTGFGTASVRHCLARVGGELWIESRLGEGTRCTLRWLAAPAPGSPAALVFDPDPVARWSWREAFAQAGWMPLDTPSAEEARAWVRHNALAALLVPRGAPGGAALSRAAHERGTALCTTGVRGASRAAVLPRVADRAGRELLERLVGEAATPRRRAT